MPVTLNCFRAAITPVRLPLSYAEYADWETASAALKRDFGGSEVYRFRSDGRVIMAFLRNAPSGLKQEVFLVEALPHLGTRLIERSLAEHFRAAGFRVHHGSFGVTALRSTPDFAYGHVELRTG